MIFLFWVRCLVIKNYSGQNNTKGTCEKKEELIWIDSTAVNYQRFTRAFFVRNFGAKKLQS